jgi:NADH-ubiquinone oxidoreductase chain 4
MLGHGLSSSGLFRIVNIYYERLGSRRFFINRGLMLLLPTFAFLIFILTASNIAAPPTINLLSEIFLMGRIIGFDLFMLLLFPLGSFIGVVFSLFIFSYSQHGKLYNMGYGVSLVSSREIHILLLHIIPVNFLILGCYFFLTTN